MSSVREQLVDAATRLMRDHVDAKLMDAAKADGWSPALWQAMSDAALPLVGIAEEKGGSGGHHRPAHLPDGCAVDGPGAEAGQRLA